MDGIRLVAVGGEHAAVLAALHQRCFDECWSADAVAGALAVPGTFSLIACRVIGPVGFILYRVIEGEGEVLGLGVSPTCRRRGIGRKLLAAALAQAEASGAIRMVLEVAVDNGAACRLYASAGFEPVGQRRSYYTRSQGPCIDALILARDLKTSSRFANSQAVD